MQIPGHLTVDLAADLVDHPTEVLDIHTLVRLEDTLPRSCRGPNRFTGQLIRVPGHVVVE